MPETVGQKLKNKRELLELSFEKVEEDTRIRSQYLRALEDDDFSALPSPIQARGFLRNYAEYLGLDLDEIVTELHETENNKPEQAEVVFEGDSVTKTAQEEPPTRPIENKDEPDESSFPPVWERWANRFLRPNPEEQEAEKTAEETLASQPEVVPAPVKEAKPTLETEADSQLPLGADSLWQAVLDRIEAVRKKQNVEKMGEISEEPVVVAEPEPEIEANLESAPEVDYTPAISSREIFNEIGRQLRQRRTMLSLTLDEIERHTKLRAHYLGQLEAGNVDELPSPVQTRGMLMNYAAFLDLDVDALLLRYADALQAQHRERHPEDPNRKSKQIVVPERVPRLRSFVAGDLLFGIGIAALLIAFAIWGISWVLDTQAQNELVEATAPSISEALIGTPFETVTVAVTLLPAEDTPLPGIPDGTFELPPPAANITVQINIIALERTYLRVLVDGEVAFDGRTIPGNAYPFEAENSIEVLSGNAAALRLIYNQRDLGLMGSFGQLVHNIYTADAVMTPTPAASPTSTETPAATPTLSATPTPTETPSPTPTLAVQE